MTNASENGGFRPQSVVSGDLDGTSLLNGRAGASEFAIGGPDGLGHTIPGANPYELLSASLAACTALTIRLQARQRKIPLSHVKVAVSYHHAAKGERDVFERSVTLAGELGEAERALLKRAAKACPVGRTLGLSADIRTNEAVSAGREANYQDDLNELPIPNIDPD